VFQDDAMRQAVADRRAALLREAESERLVRPVRTEATGAAAIRRALALLRSPQLRGAARVASEQREAGSRP